MKIILGIILLLVLFSYPIYANSPRPEGVYSADGTLLTPQTLEEYAKDYKAATTPVESKERQEFKELQNKVQRLVIAIFVLMIIDVVSIVMGRIP